MKFIQLFGLIAILVPLSLAASAGTGGELEQRAPLPAQADDAAAAAPAIDSTCDNHLKTHRPHGDCVKSLGFRKSAHNCKGKNYYCFNQATERGTCITISVARQNSYEHGECFA